MSVEDNLKNHIKTMKQYAQMMLEREDWHGLWDSAIDLQRLTDRLKYFEDCAKCDHIFSTSDNKIAKCQKCNYYQEIVYEHSCQLCEALFNSTIQLLKDGEKICWICKNDKIQKT